jgi:hypothetical protein
MPKDHSESPAAELAQQIARQVSTALAAQGAEYGAPEIRVRTGEEAEGFLDGLSGSIVIEIKYKETVFALSGGIPDGDEHKGYHFALSMKKGDEDKVELVVFEFVDGSDWLVKVTVPRWQITDDFAIEKVAVTLKKTPVPPDVVVESADALAA